jgi:hypothetical protein
MKRLQKINEEIMEMRKEMTQDRKKMMEGFRCIEKAFHVMANVTQSLGEDLSVATGTIQIDPWSI